MTDPHTPKPTTAETAEKPKTGTPEAQRVLDRAAEISRLMNTRLKQNFTGPGEAEQQLPAAERDDVALKLARREADLEAAKRIRISLQLTEPDNSAKLQEAKDNYHSAQQRYVHQAEVVARRTGTAIEGWGVHGDSWRDAKDSVVSTYKKSVAFVKRNAVPLVGVASASAYGLSSFISQQTLQEAGKSLLTLMGETGAAATVLNGGIFTLASAAGYGVGKLVGRGIDELARRKFGRAIGAETVGKYVGMISGGVGTAVALGLSATSVAWAAGVPLAVWGGWKAGRAAYRAIWPAQKVDLEGLKETDEREHHGEQIVRTAERLLETFTAVGGNPAHPIVARLNSIRDWAHALTPVPGAAAPHHTVAEVEAEWALVKPDAEAAIRDAQKRTTERAPEVQSAIAVRAQCRELRDRWDRLPGTVPILVTVPPTFATPPLPTEIDAALTGVEGMVTNFEGAAPTHTLAAIQDAYKAAAAKFETAWDKQLGRNDEVRKISMITGQCTELRTRWETRFPLPPPPAPATPTNPRLPTAVDSALTSVATMVGGFSAEPPTYSQSAVEGAYADAKKKFEDAWDKAVQRAADIRKTETYTERLDRMARLWGDLPATVPPAHPPLAPTVPPWPGDVAAAVENARAHVTDFISLTPRYSAAEVEESFKQANDKFTKAWDKAVERTDQEIPELRTAGADILTNVNNVYDDAGFTARNINHPAGRKAYGLARSARTLAQTADTRLQAARTPEEARTQFGVLRAQEDIVRTQIQEARANVERADGYARLAIAALGPLNAADIAAMRELPGQFQTMRGYVEKHQRDVAAADLRKAPSGDYERIWFGTGRTGGVGGNGRDIGRTRQEIDAHLAVLTAATSPWPKGDIQRLRTAFTAAVDPPDADGLSEFRPDLMKGVLDNADARLTHSTQEAMTPLVGALTGLRSAAGEGEAEIGLLITQCGNVSGLPTPATLLPILNRYVAH